MQDIPPIYWQEILRLAIQNFIQHENYTAIRRQLTALGSMHSNNTKAGKSLDSLKNAIKKLRKNPKNLNQEGFLKMLSSVEVACQAFSNQLALEQVGVLAIYLAMQKRILINRRPFFIEEIVEEIIEGAIYDANEDDASLETLTKMPSGPLGMFIACNTLYAV